MKKFLLFIGCVLMLSACGGSASNETKAPIQTATDSVQTVSPVQLEIQKSSDAAKEKSDELKQKADSLLENI